MVANKAEPTKGEKRRDAILAEARESLLMAGYEGLSLRNIATRLGISVGNLQYYFSCKDDLVEAVLTEEIKTSMDIVDQTHWDTNDLPTSTHSAVRALLQHHATDAGRFYAIAESLALFDPRFARLKAHGYANVLRDVDQLVGAMVPRLDQDQRARLARVMVALIDGASMQVQFGRVSAPVNDIDALADDVSAAILHLTETWV